MVDPDCFPVIHGAKLQEADRDGSPECRVSAAPRNAQDLSLAGSREQEKREKKKARDHVGSVWAAACDAGFATGKLARVNTLRQ